MHVVRSGYWIGAGGDHLSGQQLVHGKAYRRGATVGQTQECARQNAVLVCRRPEHSRMALWCDGNQPELAGCGNMAQLSGAGGLREPHQGIEKQLRVGQFQPEQLLCHRSGTEFRYAGVQPDERVPSSGDVAKIQPKLATLHQQVLAVGAF